MAQADLSSILRDVGKLKNLPCILSDTEPIYDFVECDGDHLYSQQSKHESRRIGNDRPAELQATEQAGGQPELHRKTEGGRDQLTCHGLNTLYLQSARNRKEYTYIYVFTSWSYEEPVHGSGKLFSRISIH